MNIETFDHLLQAARAQPRSQRLLFVFAAAEPPDQPTPAQQAAFEAGQGGALVPVMCVDKAPADLQNFDALVAEASTFGGAWQIVFAAAIDGRDSAAAQAPLAGMEAAIRAGRVQSYLPFDRNGRAVQLLAG